MLKKHAWANILLLIWLIMQLVTGIGGLLAGTEAFSWVLWLHGVGGYALALLIYWKSGIILDVFKRRWRWTASQIAFIALTVLLLLVLGTGWLWSNAGPPTLFGINTMVVHGGLGVVLMLLLIWHLVARWFVWRIPTATDRRAFMRFGGLTLAAIAVRQLIEPAKALADIRGAERRFTGSYEVGSFTGRFPATSWLFDYPAPIERDAWTLTIEGAVETPLRLTYDDLLPLITEQKTALLDCTGGFYTTQIWEGVSLQRLLDAAGVKETARSVTIESGSGYGRRFPLEAAQTFLLAAHVADEPLSHGHGFPLRLVAPGYRGFEWVKWVSYIRLNETSHLLQPPLPLQ